MKKIVFFLTAVALTFCASAAFAQRGGVEVTGTVTDASTGEVIPFASVRVDGTMNGASTSVDGTYSISVPSAENATLVFSFVGYKSQIVPVANRGVVDVALEPDALALQETIVVAFGTATKESFTGSAKVVGEETLAKSQVSSVTNALAGAVPGVQLTSNNGAPGKTGTLRVRGFSSINAGNDPLIIVDGAPYSGDISNINPSDVESLTVLKDAASNALYGARGANGVIMITTKTAKKGEKAQVTFDAKWGQNSRALKYYDVIKSPAQYYETHYGALTSYYKSTGMSDVQAWQTANGNLFSDAGNGGLGYNVYSVPEGQYLIGLNGKLNPNATLGNLVNYNGEDYLVTPDDWSEVGLRKGFRQEYNISVNGATDRSDFYASIGYLGNQGITARSDLERLTARLKGDYQATKWLKVGANFSYTRSTSNQLWDSYNGDTSATGNVWAYIMQLAPIYPAYIRNADGSIKVDADGIQMMDEGDNTNGGFFRPYLSNSNAILDNLLNTRYYNNNAFSGSGFATANLCKGLSVTVNASVDYDETRRTVTYNPYYGQFTSQKGVVEMTDYHRYDYNVQALINYTHTFNGIHNLDIMAGHEYFNDRYYYLYASGSNQFSQSNQEIGGTVVDGNDAYSYMTEYNNEGWFGRIQYNIGERIFLSGSIRGDASSRFAPECRWGVFWSLGAAWVLSKERWFNSSWVDELKVKASYGVQGNDNIDDYMYTDVYNIVNSAGNVGTSFSTKGTRDITWESDGNFNIGVEFGFWNRVSGSLEFYNRKTTDMLFYFDTPISVGYSGYWDNIGDMYNRGVEFDVDVNIFNTKNVRWDINLNLASLKNRVTKLADDMKTSTIYDLDGNAYNGYTSGNFFISEGIPLYTWRLREYAGVDQTTGQSMWYKRDTDDEGNYLGTVSTTTTYSDADYFITNKSTMPKVYGGFGTTFYCYGVDFSINFSYQLGGQQYDSSYAIYMSSPTSTNTGYNYHKDVLKSWTADNPSSTIPRFQYNDTYSASASTRFLTSSRYINIENINLGYTFPSKWMDKLKIASLRVYCACENVAYWSARKGFDPRQSYTSSVNATYYSPMRTISGGLTIKF
ncbi:MAG: SusC/RagA family TonB-linked outer membrane protein [Bacteroidales bacterium]|nr:SusC/RagA family TonB-linked outer membrane protein [Bacteroidales bacterium]